MKQEARIVRHEGVLMAEVVRSEACQACRACNFGQQERVYIDIGELECAEGDTVYIEIDDGSVSRASVMAYGLPLATLFAGLGVGVLISGSDIIQALSAAIGLAAGFAAVKIVDKRIGKKKRYTPKVRVIPADNGSKKQI